MFIFGYLWLVEVPFCDFPSPGGTGKSLALLCAVLAWQRRQASNETTTVPQIVYGVAGRWVQRRNSSDCCWENDNRIYILFMASHQILIFIHDFRLFLDFFRVFHMGFLRRLYCDKIIWVKRSHDLTVRDLTGMIGIRIRGTVPRWLTFQVSEKLPICPRFSGLTACFVVDFCGFCLGLGYIYRTVS